MKKRMGLLLLTVVFAMLLSACKIDMTGSRYKEHIYKDKETGVNYIWINTSTGVALSPRYNADGTLYVSK